MAGFGDRDSSNRDTTKPNKQASGEDLLKHAVNYHTQGDTMNAEKLYREAIKAGFYHPIIFSNLGIICNNSKRIEEAITLYKKAINLFPNHPNGYTNLGNIYKDLGKLDQALSITLKSLELKPDNPVALVNLGGAFTKR